MVVLCPGDSNKVSTVRTNSPKLFLVSRENRLNYLYLKFNTAASKANKHLLIITSSSIISKKAFRETGVKLGIVVVEPVTVVV
jgi:hypothetical protein